MAGLKEMKNRLAEMKAKCDRYECGYCAVPKLKLAERIEQAETEYLKFTDWLDRVLKPVYKADRFFDAAFEMLLINESGYFELAATYALNGNAHLYTVENKEVLQ